LGAAPARVGAPRAANGLVVRLGRLRHAVRVSAAVGVVDGLRRSAGGGQCARHTTAAPSGVRSNDLQYSSASGLELTRVAVANAGPGIAEAARRRIQNGKEEG